MAHDKRFKAAASAIDPAKSYSLTEAVGLLKGAPGPKFDESIDLAMNLGVDPRHADQMVRGAIVLPHGIGKDTRVLVFAKGSKESEARARAPTSSAARISPRRSPTRGGSTSSA